MEHSETLTCEFTEETRFYDILLTHFQNNETKMFIIVFSFHFFFISDAQPPSFTVTCPASPLIAYAERNKFSALVNWTEPVAIDNSGLSPTMTSNYWSPQRFSQGTHVITYSAVDQSGNRAACTFKVSVIGNITQ